MAKKKRIDYLYEAMEGHGFKKTSLQTTIDVLISMEINVKNPRYKGFLKDIWMSLNYHVRPTKKP